MDVQLVIERDGGLVRYDNQWSNARLGIEPLLALPDAVAWCWTEGGDWKRRIDPLIRAAKAL